MSACSCGLTKAHFKCASCGSHSLLDSVPCWHCRYFKFETVEMGTEPAAVVEQTVTASPAAAQKTKRRPRGVADSTQRN